ncbi:sensor histidine kinase [Bacillus sp. T33-2]|uniref:sensor histidine kinase n=1 Tax=Bacillus sp. T33-2 TaxID=2054168 RepID=UPI000C77C051|nr:PAS domain S-box protein [Bacillus sp. T33-2]PLR98442.1 histidine kinase [Bacillus sp. T33-2]
MEKPDSYSYHQLFDMIMNHKTHMFSIVDRHRRTIYATPNMQEVFGFTLEEAGKRDAFDVVHPDDREYLLKRHENLLASKQSNTSEYRVITKNGEVRHYECKTTPLPDTKDYLQVVSIRDITDRKLMEMELERQKNRYEELQKSLKNYSQDLSSVMKLPDLEARIRSELESVLPGSNPELHTIHPEKADKNAQQLPQISVGRMERVDNKMIIKIGERNGHAYILSIDASSIKEEMETIWLETLAYYTVMVFENLNVIENLMNQLETAIQSRESPQWVLRLLFNLQEQQRMTLSGDLHDTVLQDQIDLYRRLESLLNKYEIEKESKAKLKQIEQGLLDSIHQIRITCNELRPPMLRELGLERALENLFEHIQVTSTYKILFTNAISPIPPLTEEQTIGIYRIVQELLNNAEKHSKASILKFHIECEEGSFRMVYTDDGIGFNEVKLNPSFNSMGLTSMSHRAQSLGGKMEFISKPGSGLKASLELPINDERSLA